MPTQAPKATAFAMKKPLVAIHLHSGFHAGLAPDSLRVD